MFHWILKIRNRSRNRRGATLRRRLVDQGAPKYRFLPGSVVSRSEIHLSLILTLSMLSAAILIISYFDGQAEIRSAAITLPFIWFLSLIVRAATQQLAIGDYSHEAPVKLCPTGNIQLDYEYLPRKAMLAYSVSGQLASLGLMSIGLVVFATVSQPFGEALRLVQLTDFRGGWGSAAWATQIFWVNAFLFCLNLLPTVPFDNRALVLSFLCWRNRSTQEPQVFRDLADFDSHLAALIFGVGFTSTAFGAIYSIQVTGWYVAIAAAAYLFVASQWEHARAEDLEDQLVPRGSSRVRRGSSALTSHLDYDLGDVKPDSEFKDGLSSVEDDFSSDLPPQTAHDTAGQHADDASPLSLDLANDLEPSTADLNAEIDEILRKLHRDGQAALSDHEQRRLLEASQELKERRDSSTSR